MGKNRAAHPAWRKARADWSIEDSEEAAKLGWNIYASAPSPMAGHDDPPFVVWRDDASRILDDDEEAHQMLREMLKAHERLAIKARRFLKIHSHSEFLKVFATRPNGH